MSVQPIQLANPAAGSLFSISVDDWSTVNRRVGLILAFRRGWPAFQQLTPVFASYASTCDLWRTETFPLLITQSAAIVSYAASASNKFSALKQSIAQLAPGNALPATLEASALSTFSALANSTHSLSAASDTLAAQVSAFATYNAVVDAAAAAHFGEPVGGADAVVDNAAGAVVGAWKALSDDLDAIACGHIPLSSDLLLSLDIDFALRSWANLQSEAAAFASGTAVQTAYLEDGWEAGMQ